VHDQAASALLPEAGKALDAASLFMVNTGANALVHRIMG
jgi:hypothetical protein